ncbi:MAG TPA: hypothetical protein VGQ62_02780 [Chloroflexota bacterium]|nr:hypothetical protein [Chloroflexota bacterium]
MTESVLRTAFDVKAIHRQLADQFRDDELQQITILPRGRHLEQGARYYDICDGREFTALGNQVVERENCVIAKADVPYELWPRLRAVQVPQPPRPAATDRSRTVRRCLNCDVQIVDPVVQVVHGDRTFCCANCAEVFEQKGSGSDPRAGSHNEDPRCAHCESPIVYRATMETRGDKVFCCSNCAQAAMIR